MKLTKKNMQICRDRLKHYSDLIALPDDEIRKGGFIPSCNLCDIGCTLCPMGESCPKGFTLYRSHMINGCEYAICGSGGTHINWIKARNQRREGRNFPAQIRDAARKRRRYLRDVFLRAGVTGI